MNAVAQSKRGRPRKEPVRDTIRLMLAAYQQLSNGQRLIFQT